MGSTTIEKVHGCSQGACLKKWGKTGKTEKTHLCLDKSFVSVRLLYHVFSAHAVGPSIKMPPPSWLFAKGYFYCMWSGGGVLQESLTHHSPVLSPSLRPDKGTFQLLLRPQNIAPSKCSDI